MAKSEKIMHPRKNLTISAELNGRKMEWMEIVGIPVTITSIPRKTGRYDALVMRWHHDTGTITGHVTRAPKAKSKVVWRATEQLAVADLPIGVDGCKAVMQVIDKSVELIALRAK